MDADTIKFLRAEALDDEDEAIARTCTRALEGDPAAIAACEETLRNRVARAHREHRGYGHT
jgi:hypothetical protein